MAKYLEVVGLVSLVVAGFLLALWLGFVVLGVGCLGVAANDAREKRRAAELLARRRAGVA